MAPPSSSTATGLAASRRQNDGPRRVSFSETRITSSRLYDDSDDEEENERRMQEQEDAEERAPSERLGEADEGGGDGGESSSSLKRKMEESEKDIAQELDQEENKKIRVPKAKLLPANLTDSDGLIKLPIEFKKIKYKPKKGKKRDIVAAAAYSQNLVNAYHSFCVDLFPSMAFEDVLLKIEQLGSKKEVKDFLQYMRDNVRNDYLERLYGRDKAERMLQELDDGLKLGEHPDDRDDFDGVMLPSSAMAEDSSPAEEGDTPTAMDSTPTDGNISSSTRLSKEATMDTGASPKPQAESAISDDDDEEQEATFDEEFPKDAEEPEEMPQRVVESAQTVPSKESSAGASAKANDDDDDDDEEEATFDDVMDATEHVAPEQATTVKDKDANEQEDVEKDTGTLEAEHKDDADHGAAMSDKTNATAPEVPEEADHGDGKNIEESIRGDGPSESVLDMNSPTEMNENETATSEDAPATSSQQKSDTGSGAVASDVPSEPASEMEAGQ